MIVRTAQIKFGSYKHREGPYFWGQSKIAPFKNPTPGQILLETVMATESQGGKPAAVNLYDTCDVTLGLPQLCEAAGLLATKLLGVLHEAAPEAFAPLHAHLASIGGSFRKENGVWRFFNAQGQVVDTYAERQAFFYGGASGVKGTWKPKQKDFAIAWAAVLATCLDDERTFDAHTRYAANSLLSFVMPETAAILFPKGAQSVSNRGWKGAMQAIFVSFSANLPLNAHRNFQAFLKEQGHLRYDESFTIGMAQRLAFADGIGIYARRWDDIRRVVEQRYRVNLPDFASDLRAYGLEPGQAVAPDSLMTLEGVQRALLQLGYDVGPAGADGIWGRDTKGAIEDFQRDQGLVVDAAVGPKTRAALEKSLETDRA